VVPTDADAVSLDSLVQHCRSQGLSRYKHPERLVIVDTLPRNQFGKVIKKKETCVRPSAEFTRTPAWPGDQAGDALRGL